MKQEELLSSLKSALRMKIPKKTNLANQLAEILFLGKEAVYRRLRGDVPFTFIEITQIAEHYNLSLDYILGNSISNNSVFNYLKTEYVDLQERDYAQIEKYLMNIIEISNFKSSETGTVSSSIPLTLLLKYDNISRFMNMKWLYRHKELTEPIPYSELCVPQRLVDLKNNIYKACRNIQNSCYIWNSSIFSNLIDDITYFYRAGLLSREEVITIKKELYILLEELLLICSRGCYNNGNQVDVYISDTHYEATFGYFKAADKHMSLIRVFTLNLLITYDPEVLRDFMSMVNILKRQSVYISHTGEKHRVEFFNRQRHIINSLI